MLKLILLVPAAALLVLSGEGIYHAARGRQQAAVACERFRRGAAVVAARPRQRAARSITRAPAIAKPADRSRSCFCPPGRQAG